MCLIFKKKKKKKIEFQERVKILDELKRVNI